MTYSIVSTQTTYTRHRLDLPILFFAAALMLSAALLASAQTSISSPDNTFIVDDAPDQEVVCYGKTVIVKQRAQGVMAIGGDVIIEGSVSGDVAAIGGSVIQKDGSYIGGDVLIFGGEYKPDSSNPLREDGKKTLMFAGYEAEVRDLAQNPSGLFSPAFSIAFVAQRLLSVLFWFVVSLGLATLAPGAVSRAIARFQLSTLKVVAIGAAAFLATTIVVVGSLTIVPNYLSAIAGIMAFVLLMLAYVFGRVALNVSVGKLIQKRFFGSGNRSEALAILIGVVFWTLLLSVPYVWTLALFVLFSAGIGLVLTASSRREWPSS